MGILEHCYRLSAYIQIQTNCLLQQILIIKWSLLSEQLKSLFISCQ